MKKFISILGIISITVLFAVAIVHGEIKIAVKKVIPPEGLAAEEWTDDFKDYAMIVSIVAGVTSLLWFFLGILLFKVDSQPKAYMRPVWFLLLILQCIPIAWAMIRTKFPSAGWEYAYPFYVLNGILCYYFATGLYSPVSFKYIPLLARQAWRRIW